MFVIFPDNGIRGVVEVTIANCVDLSEPQYDKSPRDACKDVNTSADLEEWGILLNSTLISQKGVFCTCGTSGCNQPKGRLW